MTISHTRSSRTQTLSSWSGKKVLVTLAILLGFLSSGSLYARELNSGNIADPSFGNCPISSTTCYMSGKGITSIASGTFDGYSTLQNLHLRDNQITSIESGDFAGLTTLQDLLLFNNQITSIEAGGFVGLINLQNLHLRNNQITSIESGGFVGLDNLQYLRLNQNQITSIESGDFAGLINLQYLSFNQNQITSIESGDFAGLINLQYLHLRNNQIISIESGDFVGLDNLQELDLQSNQIISIEVGSFVGLSQVTDLYLDNNQISSISSGTFIGLDSLLYFGLGENQITSIEIGDFAGLESLNELYFYNNQITSIESGDFVGLPDIYYIDLGGNRITSIEDGSFSALPSLQDLYLYTNALNTEDTVLTDYLDGLGLNTMNYSDQKVYLGVNYTPHVATSGSVTGSLSFYGPNSQVSTLQADNTNMSIYDYLFTGNGSYVFDYTSLVDNNNYLWVDDMGLARTVLGTVTWIDNIAPGAPTIIAPISGTSMLADIASGVSVIWSGTAETGSLVTVSISGLTYTGITDSNGNFNIPTVSMLPVGSYTARVTATDSANNISPESTVTILFTAVVIPATPTTTSNGAGGGGGGVILHKDECPQGDFTASYYDKACETKSMTGQTNTGKVTTDSTTTIQSNTITYKDTDIYNDTIANNYCYKRKADVSITTALQGNNSDEFHKALSVLYAYDLTAFNSVGKFKPNNLITREQAAKMFSNFAMNVLCIQGNTDLTVSYTDIQTADASLQHYITLAYQLGLMKGGVDGNFRPKDTITQAEVTAVLVRMLLKSYLPEQQGHTRYSEYNTVAKKLGILGHNAKDTTITRQDTSLMLFRAYKNQIFELQGGSYSLKNRESFL